MCTSAGARSFLGGDYSPLLGELLAAERQVCKMTEALHVTSNETVTGRWNKNVVLKIVILTYCQALRPKPLVSKPKPKGLGLTLKSHGPPKTPHPPKNLKSVTHLFISVVKYQILTQQSHSSLNKVLKFISLFTVSQNSQSSSQKSTMLIYFNQ